MTEIKKQKFEIIPYYFTLSFQALKKSKKYGKGNLAEKRLSYVRERLYAIESCLFSFLSVEATVNELFYNLYTKKEDYITKKFKKDWTYTKFTDKIKLLEFFVHQDVNENDIFYSIVNEFAQFRNLLAHSSPKEYDILTSTDFNNHNVHIVHDYDIKSDKHFNCTKLHSNPMEIVWIDAERCYEMMLKIMHKLCNEHQYDLFLYFIDGKIDKKSFLPSSFIKKIKKQYFPSTHFNEIRNPK